MSDLLYILSATSLATLTTLYLWRSSSNSGKVPLPPGPKGVFLLGNALQMPTEKEWLTYAKWGKTWGDLMYIDVLGRPIIILSSYKAAVDLMEKRSSKYSSRPPLTMANLAGWTLALGSMPYNDRLKKYRKVLHKGLNMDVVHADYRHVIQDEIRGMLRRFLTTPKQFGSHVRRMAAAVIMKISYGYEVGDNDPIVKMANESMECFSQCSRPGAWIVDFVPILQYLPKWMPGAGFKKVAEEMRIHPYNLIEVPFAWTKKSMETGVGAPSIISRMIEAGEDEDIVKNAVGSLFGGGSDTTVSTINAFILAMSLYPNIQKRAQEEIDRVVGRDRLPTFADRYNLPYLEAIIWEILRWNPVGPLGVPHASTEEDVYEGYRIPNGSVIIANVWAIFHDERNYKDPMTFNPDRFLGPSPEMDPHNCAFGFGRRICPGFHVARDEIYLSVAQILAVFDISKALDELGREIEPPVNFSSGIISRPDDFECRLELRFEEGRDLVLP